jgi:endonuclease/exonuclease/phosphatase family metal-dependent hydrolase
LFRGEVLDVEEVREWRLPGKARVHDVDAGGELVEVPRFSRPALKATFARDGKRITFLNAHLKSKLLTYPGRGGPRFAPRSEAERANLAYCALQRRSAEARTLREHITELLGRGDEVIALGDLNDVEDAATTQLLYGPEGSNLRGPEDITNFAGSQRSASPLRVPCSGAHGTRQQRLPSDGPSVLGGSRRATIASKALTDPK